VRFEVNVDAGAPGGLEHQLGRLLTLAKIIGKLPPPERNPDDFFRIFPSSAKLTADNDVNQQRRAGFFLR